MSKNASGCAKFEVWCKIKLCKNALGKRRGVCESAFINTTLRQIWSGAAKRREGGHGMLVAERVLQAKKKAKKVACGRGGFVSVLFLGNHPKRKERQGSLE